MFKRMHHRRIETLLRMFNAEFLREAQCYFGGGTAIALSLNEYRESVDVDFLCSSQVGYRAIYTSVNNRGLGRLLTEPVEHRREPRRDRDAIRTVLVVDQTPIKIEFIREARISLDSSTHTIAGVSVLARVDLFAEKLLANTDRGLDKSTWSRDVIDLAMMIHHWGAIPDTAWHKALTAYGDSVLHELENAVGMVQDETYLRHCFQRMQMDENLVKVIPPILADMLVDLRTRRLDKA